MQYFNKGHMDKLVNEFFSDQHFLFKLGNGLLGIFYLHDGQLLR